MWLFATPWTVAHQDPLSMKFSRQEHWSGLPFPTLGDLPDAEISPKFPVLQAYSLPTEPQGKPLRVSMHSDYQWCSWWMPHHCPLGSFGSWMASQPSLPPALALFSSTFPCWGWKPMLPSLKESEQLHYFSSQCKNQVWPLLLLHQEERIRTWENHYKKQQLLSSILLYTHMDTSVLSSSSISLNWGKKKKRKDRIYKWDAGKFCWGHIQLGNRAETELKLKGEVEKRGVKNRIPAG